MLCVLYLLLYLVYTPYKFLPRLYLYSRLPCLHRRLERNKYERLDILSLHECQSYLIWEEEFLRTRTEEPSWGYYNTPTQPCLRKEKPRPYLYDYERRIPRVVGGYVSGYKWQRFTSSEEIPEGPELRPFCFRFPKGYLCSIPERRPDLRINHFLNGPDRSYEGASIAPQMP